MKHHRDRLCGGGRHGDLRSRYAHAMVALAAELGQRAQSRCWEQASRSAGHWEIAAAEAETMITAAWRCQETIAASSNQFQDRPPA